MNLPFLILATSALALSACATAVDAAAIAAAPTPAPAASADNAHDVLFERLTALCGQAFEGRITAEEPPAGASDPFHGQRLVMHVRQCSSHEIRIPFHVGSDRSRTWVVSRTNTGLRLKHDHRLADGSEDPITQYGGDTLDEGTAGRQTFPADAESKALFSRNDMSVSNANVWAIEIEPGETFTYELARPQRLFRVSFDLSAPVAGPAPPWGASNNE